MCVCVCVLQTDTEMSRYMTDMLLASAFVKTLKAMCKCVSIIIIIIIVIHNHRDKRTLALNYSSLCKDHEATLLS